MYGAPSCTCMTVRSLIRPVVPGLIWIVSGVTIVVPGIRYSPAVLGAELLLIRSKRLQCRIDKAVIHHVLDSDIARDQSLLTVEGGIILEALEIDLAIRVHAGGRNRLVDRRVLDRRRLGEDCDDLIGVGAM